MAMAGDRLQIVLAAKDEISAQIKQTKSDLTSLGRTANEMQRRIESGEQGLQGEYERTRRELENNRRKLIELGREQADVNREMRNMTSSGRVASMNLSRSFDTVTRKLGVSNTATDRLRNSLERLDNGAYAFRQKWTMALASVERRMKTLTASQGFMTLMSMAKGGAAAVGLVGAAGATMGLTTRAQIENQQIALEQLLGTKKKAAETMRWIMQAANETPFGMTEITAATQKLLGFGFGLEETKRNVMTIGNAAAGTGTGAEGIDQITRALGQMQAKQKITGEEMMQLTEAGIPAWKLLAKQMGMSTSELMEMASSQGGGAALFAQGGLDKLFTGLDKQYGGVMEKQSRTLGGRWSTFTDTLRFELSKLFDGKTGKGLKDLLKWAAEEMPKAFRQLRPVIRDFTAMLRRNGPAIMGVFKAIVWVVKNVLWRWITLTYKAVGALVSFLSTAIGKVVEWAKTAWDAIKTAGSRVKEWFGNILDGIGTAFDRWSDIVRNVINTVIGWLNKIPGVNIDLITDPSALVPGRWMGGDVIAGQRYMVGEIGPELFVGRDGVQMIGENGPEVRSFPTAGIVIPNHLLGAVAATPQVTVNVPQQSGGDIHIGSMVAADPREAVREVERMQARQRRLARERS